MARIRTIKPEFWTDEALIECSVSARLLFIGTWNFADDAGNLDRSSKQLKARIFPADIIDCEPLVHELISHGLLTEYSVNGKKYLHIQNFTKHQIINRPSKPVCPEYNDSLSTQAILTEHSLQEGKGKERNINPCASSDDECADEEKSNSLYTKQFLAFWELYPRKKSKGDAAKAFSKVPKSEYPAVRVGIESAMKSPEWMKNGGEFIPYPASWLRARGWEDENAQVSGKPFDVNEWMRERNAA